MCLQHRACPAASTQLGIFFLPSPSACFMQAIVFVFVQGDACLHIGHKLACARAPTCLQAAQRAHPAE